MKGFLDFVREQGVVGFAVGFIFGGAVSKLVATLIEDIINSVTVLGLGGIQNLSDAYIQISVAKIM